MGIFPRRLRRIAAACAAIGVLVRGIALVEVGDAPYFRYLVLDASTYHRIALAGDPAEPFYHPPLYPWLLRAVYLAAGPGPTAMRILQILGGGAVCALVVALVGRLGGNKRSALAGGLVAALYGPLVYFDLDLLPVSLATLLVTGLALTISAAPVVSGLLFGAGILLLPSLGLSLVATTLMGARRNLRGAAIMASIATVLILPVTVRNWTREADLVPISYNGGVNLWLGNNADYPATLNARPGQQWERVAQLPTCRGSVTTRAELSGWYVDEVIRAARADPTAALVRLADKALEALNAREIGRNRDIYEVWEESRLLRGLLLFRGFPAGILIPVAAVGAAALWRRRPLARRTLVLLLSVLLVGVVFFPTARYRAPVIPLAVALAAAGAPLATWRHWLLGAVFLAVCALPSRIPTIPASATPYAIGLDRFSDGDLDGAAMWLEAALVKVPDDVDALTLLGHIRATRGRMEEASEALSRAVAADPHADKAWEFIGSVANARGDRAGALAAWARAVHENPCNQDARARLSRAHAAHDER